MQVNFEKKENIFVWKYFSVSIFVKETEIKYSDAKQDILQKEKKYNQLCGKVKQKEQSYEHKMQELNLKLEQDKFISKMLNDRSSSASTCSNYCSKFQNVTKKKWIAVQYLMLD